MILDDFYSDGWETFVAPLAAAVADEGVAAPLRWLGGALLVPVCIIVWFSESPPNIVVWGGGLGLLLVLASRLLARRRAGHQPAGAGPQRRGASRPNGAV